MRYSQTLIPTVKETPAEAEVVSHKLMLRAGYIRKLAAGIYIYLPLALRVIRKIEKIIREEMTSAGAEELLLPVIMPSELWIETGRWDFYGKELQRFRDRHDRDFCVGPTHEEAITDLARREIKSYRDMPKNLFQIQTKFRDEIRPRFGLMRGREFLMKDGYSFDIDEESTRKSYDKMFTAYCKIFTRCGLDFRPVEAATGTIGGTHSHEFQVIADSGEDAIFFCDKCDYAASFERARTIAQVALDKINNDQKNVKAKKKYKEVSTPGQKTVDEVSAFLKIRPDELVKTMIYKVSESETKSIYVAALVAGDDEIVEPKLTKALFSAGMISTMDVILELADEVTVAELTRSPVGFAGPVGLQNSVAIVADSKIFGKAPFVTGANKNDTHLTNVSWEDCNISKFVDIRRAREGDPCSCDVCKGGRLKERRGIEVGQVFYLGTKYTKAMNATYLDKNGEEKLIVMGTYGIGVSRTAAASIEQNHDEHGIIWPLPIAPYHIHLIELPNKDERVKKLAEEVYCKLGSSGIEVLYDDRDARPGVKFADADLIGIPYQVVIGTKALEDNSLEIKNRKTGEKDRLQLDVIIAKIKGEIGDTSS